MLFALVSDSTLLTPEPSEATVPWWSFTKTVLAGAAMSLVRDGLLGLDDALPEGPFTLRQLLRHEAGLADYSELADYHAAVARNDAPWTAEDMLHRLDATRLRYTPGEGWRYSNVGYLFVAKVIERLTDLQLAQALNERVFSPLGLSGIRLATAQGDITPSTYAPGWVYHGLLVGPLAQAALCLDRLLAGHLLPVSMVQDMQAARVLGGPIAGRPWISPGYGLGLMHGAATAGWVLSGHTGAGPGSVIAVYRSTFAGVSATCAVFDQGANEGSVEAQALQHLSSVLR